MTPDEIAAARARRYNATVVHLHRVHSDLMILRVRPDFPRPAYKPGQYVTLGLGYWEPRTPGCQEEHLSDEDRAKVVRRSYSISSSIYASPGVLRDMTQDDWLEFYIVLVREGEPGGRVPALTPRLFELKEGDRLQVGERIVGHFTLDPVQPGDAVLFLGTGTGEAPHNHMVWELLRRGHTGPIVHACCVRYLRDLGYLATHQQLMQQFPHYKYLPLATREAGLSKKAYIQDLLLGGELDAAAGGHLDPARTHVYLCGNPKMIGVPVKNKDTGERTYPEPTGVIQLLEDRGFAADQAAAKIKGNVHFEEYW
jgi:ferredoxin/flavodoxin---NADP+ reductase